MKESDLFQESDPAVHLPGGPIDSNQKNRQKPGKEFWRGQKEARWAVGGWWRGGWGAVGLRRAGCAERVELESRGGRGILSGRDGD